MALFFLISDVSDVTLPSHRLPPNDSFTQHLLAQFHEAYEHYDGMLNHLHPFAFLIGNFPAKKLTCTTKLSNSLIGLCSLKQYRWRLNLKKKMNIKILFFVLHYWQLPSQSVPSSCLNVNDFQMVV